jgi:integrase
MSVRKRIWTTEAGEEREAYLCQYSIPELDKRGKRKRVVKTFEKKKDAVAFEAAVRVDVSKGIHVPASKSITVAEAGRNWLAACADLEMMTVIGYEQHLRDHINPRLGALKLSAVTVGVVRDWQDHLRKAGRSADMVRRVTVSLGSLLADAQERGHCATNAVRSLKVSRKRGQKTERRAKGRLKVGVDIPTPTEIDAILGAADGRWRPLLLVAIRCGLRASELRGLRWVDIDFKGRELHVTQRADARNRIGPPKSEAGRRTIPIPPTTLQALREWKLACPKGELGLVFPSGSSKVENHANIVTRGLAPTLVKAGVVNAAGEAKYSGLHALRHFFASWCINCKADGGRELPIKLVQARMGHASIQVTSDVYGHLFPRGDDSAELAAAEGRFG